MDLLQRHLGPLARRVSVLPALTPADYHGLLALADVVLDPFPFSGVNTTYDAISFHRPMVTMPGSYQRGRFPLGCLRRMGLEDWAAGTVEEYVRRAVTWGRDRDARQWATEQLADRSDAVFDDPRAAGELDDLFHRLTHEV
jgi:predicted O-linked N-acetylglucosamine transferase (SPINDLY family)